MMKNKVWGDTADARYILQGVLREMMDIHTVIGEMAELLNKIYYKENHGEIDKEMGD